MHKHSGCCGCYVKKGMARRTFLASLGGSALAGAAFAGQAAAEDAVAAPVAERPKPSIQKKPLVVQPVLAYNIFERRDATSWRPWGGLHTEADVDQEINRIGEELKGLSEKAEFPVTFRPVARAQSVKDGETLRDGDADVMLIYGATSGGEVIEAMISPKRHNLVFVRHKSGPVYLWYEIVHPRLLRKTVDVYGQPGLDVYDVIVDSYDDILWRLRSLYALNNTVGSRIVAIGGPSGWGAGMAEAAPKISQNLWKMDLQTESYDDLGKRIIAARKDANLVARAEAEAAAYLGIPGTELQTDKGFVVRAFLLSYVFEDIMAEAQTPAITVNNCMGTIMPLSETTACLTLSLLNDAGYLAFCESDFVVIPSGVLLQNIASMPVFLQDPTYPHHGQVTLAHCTAPRKMDGKTMEKTLITTHYESDYGAAPKVDLRLGQVVTVIDPDFNAKRWIGFRGTVLDNPFLDICRSQSDIGIEGDWRRLMEDMVGFHWMLAYGDHLKEMGYAVRKMGIDWLNISDNRTAEA